MRGEPAAGVPQITVGLPHRRVVPEEGADGHAAVVAAGEVVFQVPIRVVELRVLAALVQAEAVQPAVGVGVVADDITAVGDVPRLGPGGAGDVDGPVALAVEDVAMDRTSDGSGVLAVRGRGVRGVGG